MVFRLLLIVVLWFIIVFVFLRLWNKHLSNVNEMDKELVQIKAIKGRRVRK